MKQYPLVPEKPGCRPTLAVLSSEMLAGDRQALLPRSWLGQRHHYCRMRYHRNVMGYKFRSPSRDQSQEIIVYGLRMPSIQYCARIHVVGELHLWNEPTVNSQAKSQDSAPDIRYFRKAQYEMAARAERKRSGASESQILGSRQGREELPIHQSLGMIKPK
jgi:hypothetical protein